MNVSVPIGEWFKVEVFWHRSTGQDGRVWMAVDGQKIVDRYGPNVGEFSYPINRVIVSNVYTSTGYPAYQWVDDLVVRDRMPPQ